MTNRKLLLLGVAGPVLFWTTTSVCGWMLSDYDHLRYLVSELGAVGTPSRYVFSFGLVVCSILNVLFVLVLYRCCRRQGISTVPVVLLFFFSFLAGPAIVPMPLPLHGVIGLPMLVFLLSPPAALVLWAGSGSPIKIGMVAVLSMVFLGLGFLVYFPGVLPEYFGLKQRFLYTGWTIWSVGLAFHFWRTCPELGG